VLHVKVKQQEEPFSHSNGSEEDKFRLSYYPHRVENFKNILRKVFGPSAELNTLGDWQPLDGKETPAYYIHIIKKPLN
jgi:glycine N-methyltransferase